MILDLLFFSLIIQAVLFVPAFIRQTDKLTDFSYGLTFIILALFGLLQSAQTIGHYLLSLMIIIWALRLAVDLVIRIRKIRRDKRFDGMREKFFSFAGFWLLQGVSVWAIMLASSFYFFNVASFNLLSLIGFIIWLIGLLIESVADQQKYKFINDENNKS